MAEGMTIPKWSVGVVVPAYATPNGIWRQFLADRRRSQALQNSLLNDR